jgi:DNA-binding MarR family transcriptional regulator
LLQQSQQRNLYSVADTATTDVPADPAWWDAWRGILFASAKVLNIVERDLLEHSGFSLNFMDVMGRLHDAPDQRLRMQELQERSLFTHSGMTRVVDRVERAGYVRRESVPGDRRGVFVVLTPEGKRAYEEALEKHYRDIEREFATHLTPDQQRAVADALHGFWHEG